MPKPPAAEPENVWKEIIAQAQVAGNGAQDCGARHAGDTVNPDSNGERPAGCRSPVGERGRNTDFTGWPSVEGQTGSQHALEGKTMNAFRNLYQVFDENGTLMAHVTAEDSEKAAEKFARASGLTEVMHIEQISRGYHRDVCEIFKK
ncbi:hypothetical protein ACSQ43_005478 [Pseudomonas aeruginosa]|uniref:hypothetical protein n=2 Tax=Pseudomonas aeruginosa TaxID=287 RepID=UPI00128F981D|nr:hypothetical protein [Pseudomonas aeruginosa]EIU4875495.1 hypothetical protein [Pseudomonas aeruginosa]MBG5628376.1 hypothetical protein [Pseudomonas aeruginosa]MBI8068353.1 hypothetical protein [Pseudomonas aeruginosa]HBO2966685.1 hypothetical protein [Pseudomonas aeruginosa]HBO4171829.1 hypothetical protein [Pseudomonas aeruginosa]